VRVKQRCWWAGSDPLYVEYHDDEWGVPCHDDVELFERLALESFQAGLSWSTILRKREGYRRAFAGFDPARVAAFGPDDVARLLADPGIVRNRAKVDAAIGNARAWLRLADEVGSPAAHLWSFVDGVPLQNAWRDASEIPAETDASRAMSRDLRKRGFRFMGPTIAYAFMQSAGMVNDHVVGCFRHAEVAAMARRERA
jgi:DNA-3-methyladenine glycosylase I